MNNFGSFKKVLFVSTIHIIDCWISRTMTQLHFLSTFQTAEQAEASGFRLKPPALFTVVRQTNKLINHEHYSLTLATSNGMIRRIRSSLCVIWENDFLYPNSSGAHLPFIIQSKIPYRQQEIKRGRLYSDIIKPDVLCLKDVKSDAFALCYILL